MKLFSGFLTVLLAITMIQSCETDFSLNGDYEVNPIVFGLLDHKEDFHVVKITKAFLGDGDNLQYAKNPDSNYFEQVDAKIIEYKNDEETGREWTLFDTVLTNKSTDGVFYAPEQKVYAFYESDLDSTAEYEIIVDINGGDYQVTGKTELLYGFAANTFVVENSGIPFAPPNVTEDEDYGIWQFNVTEATNGARYSYKYVFRWRETYDDNSTEVFELTRNNGDQIQEKGSNPLTQQVFFRGVDFYQWIADEIPDDASVVKREFLGIDLRIAISHEELEQYMEISEPATGIAQVQPEFTNLTGGRGLFSARLVHVVKNIKLNSASMEELCTGIYTGGKSFCSNYPEHSGEFFFCP